MESSHSGAVEPALTVSGIGLLSVSVPNNPMSQSKPSYGVSTPKGTENEYCQHQNTSVAKENARAESEPEPACWRRRVDDWEWHETEFNAAFAGMYGSCPDCFDGGPPDVDELETVVRSCSYPSSYHRVFDPVHADSDAETGTATGSSRFENATIEAQRVITDITKFEEGDGVLWKGQSTPLTVVDSATEASGTVRLRGPNGGEYQVTNRPNHSQPIAIYPGFGLASDVCRIVPADDQPRPEAV
jgi:hypothetical protein